MRRPHRSAPALLHVAARYGAGGGTGSGYIGISAVAMAADQLLTMNQAFTQMR